MKRGFENPAAITNLAQAFKTDFRQGVSLATQRSNPTQANPKQASVTSQQ